MIAKTICDQFGIPCLDSGHHHCTRGWIQLHCPWCTNGTHGWHLGWSESGTAFNCWRCGKVPFWKTLRLIVKSQNWAECLDLLQKRATLHPREDRRAQAQERAVRLPSGTRSILDRHRRYLTSRKFDPDQVSQTWDLMGCGSSSGRWSWRIIIPVYDSSYQLMAYVGRAISPKATRRYLNSSDEENAAPMKSLLYGGHLLTNRKKIIVVEGPADAWRIGPGAVSTLGMNWTVEQAAKLSHYAQRFILFDHSEDAQRQAESLADYLTSFPGSTEIIDIDQPDPACMTNAEASKLRKELGL